MRSITVSATFIIILIFAVLPGFAQGVISSENTYRLEADEITGTDNVSFTARGNVKVTFKNSVVTADEATYYPRTRILEAAGNVTVRDDVQVLTADRITYDLNSETGNIDNATGILNGEYYVCARKMDRVGKEYYIMEGVRITTCSNPAPEWSFSFHKVEAEINGYLFGDHATGNIKDFPLLYSPKLVYPLKIDRQTGFLIPSIGYSSDLGTFIKENFFWAIAYDKDITLGANAFTDRGLQGVGEARWAIDRDSNIYLAGDAINDLDSNVNVDGRWRYVSKSLIELPYNFEILADAYKVSDYMYMRDFGDMGLYKEYDTDANNYYQQYHMKWRSKWVDATFMYRAVEKYTDVTTGAAGYVYTLTERKPSVSLQKNFLSFGWLNLDYLASWDNVRHLYDRFYFTRPTREVERNYDRIFGRVNLYHTFRLPILKFTPTISGTYTHWQDFDPPAIVETHNTSPFTFVRSSGNGYDRAVPIINLTADLNEIYKIFPEGGRHGILNRFRYTFVQGVDQAGLPNFLAYDRISRRNTLSWTMRNYLKFSNGWQADLSVIQAVNFDTDQAFQPLTIRSSVSKALFFSNSFEMKYDYYASDNITYETSDRFLTLTDTVSLNVNPFSFNASYSYDKLDTDDYNTSLRIGASALFEKIKLEGWVQWQAVNDILSLSGLEPVENEFSVTWVDQCWSLGLEFSTSKYNDPVANGWQLKRDYIVELSLELRGIGDSTARVYKNTKNYE